MTVSRREVLGTFGAASASTLLWALGCSGARPAVRRAPQVSGEVRSWLHDAVARLVATYPTVHALAVSRRRTAAALDVLGAGAANLRADGLVLTVRGRDGAWREHVTAELTQSGVDAAVTALGGPRQRKSLGFGPAPATADEPPRLDDRDLRHRLELMQGDATRSSRIIYAAALVDIDDAIVWSVAPGRDLEQRLVRIRESATRAVSNGTLPVIREVERAWSGWLDDHPLTPDDVASAGDAALQVSTPGTFTDGEYPLVLDPSVVALLLDTAVRGLLTTTAARSPDIARRAAPDAQLAAPALTLLDDPTAPAAYGGFAFDDEGERAAPLTLLDAGRVTARLADHAGGGAGRGRRLGHLSPVSPSPSHLVVSPGTAETSQLYSDGFILEGGLDITIDLTSTRVRLACARARELKAGNPTGRLYGDIELVGSLASLLTAIDGIARDPATVRLGVDTDRHRRWSSISTPAIRTRGFVRARRSRA